MNGLGIIVFDMDGTLIDSMDLYTDTFCQVLDQSSGIPKDLSREVFLSTAGMPLDRQFQLAIDEWKITSNTDVHKLNDYFWDLVQRADVSLVRDADRVVRELDSAGYTLVVSSGSIPSVVASRMKQANIAQYFKLLLGTDYNKSAEIVKGDGHFRAIQRELSIPPSVFRTSSVMVGDGPHDVVIAKRAGIMSIAKVTSRNIERLKNAGADWFIKNLPDLIDVLSRLLDNHRVFVPISELASFKQGGDLCSS